LQKYINGDLENRDTFSKRVLSEEPKFVKKKKASSEE